MARLLKPKFEEVDLGVNHLTANLKITYSFVTEKGFYVGTNTDTVISKDVVEEGKEVHKIVTTPNLENKRKQIERGNVTKIYISPDNRKIVAKLGPSAKSIWLWLQYEMTTGKDYVWFNIERYKEENEVGSDTTVRNGLNELLRYFLLGRTAVGQHMFWVNPGFMFNGSRLTKFPQYAILYEPTRTL